MEGCEGTGPGSGLRVDEGRREILAHAQSVVCARRSWRKVCRVKSVDCLGGSSLIDSLARRANCFQSCSPSRQTFTPRVRLRAPRSQALAYPWSARCSDPGPRPRSPPRLSRAPSLNRSASSPFPGLHWQPSDRKHLKPDRRLNVAEQCVSPGVPRRRVLRKAARRVVGHSELKLARLRH